MVQHPILGCVLLAAIAGLAAPSPAAAQESGSAPAERQILIVNDGAQDLITTSLFDKPVIAYWYPSQRRQADPAQPAPVVAGLRVTAWPDEKDKRVVKVKLAVLTGRWIYNVPPNGVKEKSLSTYSVRDTEPVTTDDGVRYGLPVLHLRLGRELDQCLGDPAAIENLTAAIKVEGFPSARGWCYLLLRNTSRKGIAAIGVTRKGGRRGGPSPEGMSGNPLAAAMIGPGQTYSYITNTPAQPGQNASVTSDPLTIHYVVFEDGTWEGDEPKAMQWVGRRVGFFAELAKFAPVLRDMLNQPSYADHESTFVADLRVKVSGLPEFDADASQLAETRLKPSDPIGFRVYVGDGMRSAKQDISRWIDGYASPKEKKERKVSFRSYWESILAKAEAGVAQWNMAVDQRRMAGQ